MSLGSTGVRGGLVTLASQAIKIVTQLAGLVVLSRLLSPEDFGLIAIITAVVAFGDLFRDFGLTFAAIQAKTLLANEKTNLFWLNVVIGCLFAAILTLSAGTVSSLFHDPRLEMVLVVMSVTFVANGVQAQFRVQLVRNYRFLLLAIAESSAQILGLAVAIILAWQGAGYWALAIQHLCIVAAITAVTIAAARWFPGLPRRNVSLKKYVGFGKNLALSQILGYFASNADSMVIGARFGAQSLGFYNRAFQLLMVPVNQLLAPLTSVVLPILSRLQIHDPKFIRFIRSIHLALSYGSLLVFAIVIVAGEPIVEVALGNGWERTADVLRILALGGIFQTMNFVGYWAFLAAGATASLLRYNLITKTATVICVVIGSRWGIDGIAWAYSMSLIATWPFLLIWLQRLFKISFMGVMRTSFRVIALGCVSVGGGLLGSIYFSVGDPLQSISITISIQLCLYILSLLVPTVRADLREMIRFLRLARRQELATAG
ncbi:lipopolysaccharide biosynthesis protein [Pseudarthrobacter sp. AB1]|uniref:lipopolysaccharide biosynthesis protein n=1 Tax=Pseudarthrobacter sp. AB1 TaxID=2138309 RepID=UPI00186B6A45|nr:lipopolysaccharide biosynthesis protein [Pseudarthrobacter sp. AB1]MBE4717475.1 lipopolysaccharide biosynthesis protein [Pseudarthrobacter sp. AB1]